MRYLLIPSANSLSHLFKCLAVAAVLRQRGHDVLIGAGKRHESFLQLLSFKDYEVLPDIQEADGAGLPTVEWFKRPERIRNVIRAEVDLIKDYGPDRVLGVFRFTTKVSCGATGVPYDLLACGCMLPDCQDALGFNTGESGIETQAQNLDGFYRYTGAKLSRAAVFYGFGSLSDIRFMLKGERTLLWDIPQFLPLREKEDLIHVGPIFWDKWPGQERVEALVPDGQDLAIISFGTCVGSAQVAERIIRVLLDMGYFVVLAAGDQPQLSEVTSDRDFVNCSVSLSRLLPRASLVVTHGGQMTVFESLHHRVPVLVMPFQPEQAHSGVCLEHLGCGARLIPARPFRGNSAVYTRSLASMTDEDIAARIRALVDDPAIRNRLIQVSEQISRYRGAETVADVLEAL